jgi:subfamily B ATP-binding cassette protein MsbA
VQEGLAGAERIFELMDTSENSIENTNTEKKELNIRGGKIEIKDLHFSYDNKKVLENLHLLIPAGKKIALVGLSGSGKSTIISLLLHFFTNYKGKILIDDQNINDCSLKSLRNNIGLVTQETMLFNDTIETNIKYGNLNASLLEIEKAANEAGVNEFTNSMPNKLNTIVGEGGIKLSGGQRQRIAIARALLKNAPILLLDEATSALDNLTEQKIQYSINQLMKNKTSLIVAHRLSTIENADLIYVLDNGKIVDSGSHEKLLSSCKLYSQLHLKEKLEHFLTKPWQWQCAVVVHQTI